MDNPSIATVVITATFTAEPIQASLDFWSRELDLPFRVAFAPYNQVFQQLLDPASIVRSNRNGLNVILIRPDDWCPSPGDGPNSPSDKHEAKSVTPGLSSVERQTAQENVINFLRALRSAAEGSTTPYLVCTCPQPPDTGPDRTALCRQMDERIATELSGMSNVHLIRGSELMAVYPVSAYYDLYSDRLGHVPYTPAFFAALGTGVARRYRAIRSAPHKVIVLDCDYTLWKGVCGEDGPGGIEVDPPRRRLQEFMVRQLDAGMLLCLCSRNNEQEVMQVFEHHPEMPLQRRHLVSWRINWESKSQNLRSLADELQLGLDSFIFIDDDPVQCAEVRTRCPEVLTLQLPQDAGQIPHFLNHVWAFDHARTTEEDRSRTLLYQQNVQRERFREQSMTFADFLTGLDLKVTFLETSPAHFARVAQLTQRTNQFNFTGIRRSEGEIRELCGTGRLECLTTEVSDRFGDYGLVGAVLFAAGADAITVDTFLLSCRALGRGVEHRMMAELGRIAGERGLRWVEAACIPSGRNQPAMAFLQEIGASFAQTQEAALAFKFPVEYTRAIAYRPDAVALPSAEQHAERTSSGSTQPMPQAKSTPQRVMRIATTLNRIEQILEAIESRHHREDREPAREYVAPADDIEQTVADIWQEVLNVSRVGMNDSFIDLGGNSLRAVQILSRLYGIYRTPLPLRTLFDVETAGGLAGRLRETLGLRLRSEGTDPSCLPPAPRGPGMDRLPLSASQERFWFLNQLQPENASDNIAVGFRVRGPLDVTVLGRSLAELVRRHEVLRTTFEKSSERAVQRIWPSVNVRPVEIDLRNCPRSQREAEIQRFAREQAGAPFDLATGPLLRAAVLHIGADESILLLAMHHIISDGWSLGVLYRELSALYGAFSRGETSPLPDPLLQYGDFTLWYRQWLEGGILESQLSYWRQRLHGDPVLELPTDKPRPAIQTFRGAKRFVTIPGHLCQELRSLGRQEQCTLFMTLLAAFQTLLRRYTGQEDVAVGSPVANRTRPEARDMPGPFLNMVVLRTDLSGDPTFLDLLQRVREVALGVYANQDAPFEKVVEAVRPRRDTSRSPLFQVMLEVSPVNRLELPGLDVTPLEFDSGTAQYDLSLRLAEGEEDLTGHFEYNTDLFDAPTIDRLAEHFRTLLESVVADPARHISELPILPDAQRHQLLVEWNDTRREYPQDRCIHQWFEAQAQQTPEATALVFEGRRLSYRQLNERANQLAHLLQSWGVGPDVPVGVALERSLEMVVGLYAILKAGGAYMPLDPSYPAERLAYMAQEAGVRIVLTQARLLDTLPEFAGRVLCLDRDWDDQVAGQSVETPVCNATLEDLAYIIYTSGSTGRPKGVMNTHRGILNRLLWMQEQYGLTASDRVLQKTPFSFDVSVWEFFWPLMFGARLVVARPEGHKDCEYLVQTIREEQITVVHFVPSMLQLFMETRDVETCDSLRHVICSGEALSMDLQDRFFDRLGARLHNLYGPTEAAVDVTFWDCRRDSELKTVPIGHPVANTQIYILDSQMQPAPVGVPGELHIGGVQVARGYVNRPDLTAERFVPDPFSDDPAARLYKTGDLARYLPDGNIEYMGRLDHQIKMRGLRIELAEIESVLIQHPAVREAVVVAREDTPGDQRLVAYAVPQLASPLDAKELRDHLAQSLPDYMVPAAFVTLDALPLTSSGKVDRRSLPAPKEQTRSEGAYLAPRTSLEEAIAQIWRDLLCVEQVGVHDNFFDLGGHSLLLVQAHRRVRGITDKDLSIADLFRFSTVGSLAEHLSRDSDSESAQAQAAVQRSVHRAMARKAAILRRQQAI